MVPAIPHRNLHRPRLDPRCVSTPSWLQPHRVRLLARPALGALPLAVRPQPRRRGVLSSHARSALPWERAGVQCALYARVVPHARKIAIHAAVNPDICGRKMINMVDCTQPTTFDQLWPAVASWLSLVGVGPSADNTGKSPGDYIEEHKHVFGEKGRPKALSAGVGAGHKQLESGGWQLKFDRLRAVGFTEERSPEEGWLEAFDKFRARHHLLTLTALMVNSEGQPLMRHWCTVCYIRP